MASNASARNRPPSTIREVAAAAGVSIGTASKALRGQGQLREDTRERVRLVAEQLSFRPNDLAQSLHRKKSFTVGLLSNDSYGRFTIPILEGIQEALANAGVSVFLCNAFDDPARERQHVHSLLSKRVDGVIVTSRRTDPRPPVDLENSGLPLLYAFTRINDPDASVWCPTMSVARASPPNICSRSAGAELPITGPERFESARLRREGFEAALTGHGVTPDPAHILMGPWSEMWGHEAIARLMEVAPDIDAIFCGSDQIARGTVDALRERGVRVPDDIAIVGYDNWEVVAAATRPPLTTIDMNLRELGREAGALMLGSIDGRHAAGTRRIPCRLIVRQSCGGRAG